MLHRDVGEAQLYLRLIEDLLKILDFSTLFRKIYMSVRKIGDFICGGHQSPMYAERNNGFSRHHVSCVALAIIIITIISFIAIAIACAAFYVFLTSSSE